MSTTNKINRRTAFICNTNYNTTAFFNVLILRRISSHSMSTVKPDSVFG